MTLEEKIEQEKLQIEENWEKLAYAVTLDNQHLFDTCLQNIKEHEQLTEWLEELKAYREIGTVEECKGCVLEILEAYNKAIDDFVHECDKCCGFYSGKNKNITREDILKIAKQLKAGVENE